MRNKLAGLLNAHSIAGLISTLIVSHFILFAAASDINPPEIETKSARFEFALIGDMPYDASQKKEFVLMMNEINLPDLAFIVHTGDFWFDGIAWKETSKGFPPCSNETYKDRLSLAQSSRHPFIFVPGDNDWTDCHRAKPNPYNPLERLSYLRQTFYRGRQSLGSRAIRLTRQSEKAKFARFRENVRWEYGDVLFVTLHIVGSNNNLNRTPEMDEEYAERNNANLVWMREAFSLADDRGYKAIMIFAHANLQFENTWPAILQKRYMLKGLDINPPEGKRITGYDEFLMALEKETQAYAKPVVYVHGDTHTFRIDKPLVGSGSGRMIENFTRVETFGYRNTHWIRVIVEPGNPNVFSFRQQIVKDNLVKH